VLSVGEPHLLGCLTRHPLTRAVRSISLCQNLCGKNTYKIRCNSARNVAVLAVQARDMSKHTLSNAEIGISLSAPDRSFAFDAGHRTCNATSTSPVAACTFLPSALLHAGFLQRSLVKTLFLNSSA
jgi:hypothetical protein